MIIGVTKEEEAAIKEALLQKYAMTEINQFIQFDGFTNTEGDSFIPSDENGEGIMSCQTKELMSGRSAVRVLIRDFEDPLVAVRLLRKIADSIEGVGTLWPEPNQIWSSRDALVQ